MSYDDFPKHADDDPDTSQDSTDPLVDDAAYLAGDHEGTAVDPYITMRAVELFEANLEDYYNEWYRYFLARTARAQDAEDLAQETYLAAQRNIAQFRGGDAYSEGKVTLEQAFQSWLFGIARNYALMHFKKQSIRAGTQSLETPGVLATIELSNPEESPEQSVVLRDYILRLVSRAKLTMGQRQLAQLFFFEDQSIEELTALLNISPGTLRARIFRIRQQFRDADRQL